MEETKDNPTEETASPGSGDKLVRKVKKATRKRFTAEEKIRIVLEGFRKEIPVAELCRREGIHAQVYYAWLKDFIAAGKAQLKKDTLRNANRSEVKALKKENERLKETIGDMALENSILKKTMKK